MNIFANVEKKIEKLKSKAVECMNKKDYELALQMIACIASIEYLYNQKYIDEELEELLLKISEKAIDVNEKEDCLTDTETVMFYDGFGLDMRGLALIYLKALAEGDYRIVYVTKEKNLENLKEIKHVLKDSGGYIVGIPDKVSNVETARFIYKTTKKYSVGKAFFYTTPSDVSGVAAFNKFPNSVTRFQINLTDHAFWLGIHAFDYCIEFRNYGASISYFKRKIDCKKILLQPYYPLLSKHIGFQGFPFQKEDDDFIIFSGGALYKTEGGKAQFYRIVSEILSGHKNVKFWYAGFGENKEMDKLLAKYPKQAFYTEERKDLYQILRHCDIYLNTYPLAGGLMTQYAAAAGLIPLTIKTGEHAEELLLNQKQCGIDFDTTEELLNEFEKIFSDPIYKKKKELMLRDSVLKEEDFNKNIKYILEQYSSAHSFELKEVNDKEFIRAFKEKYTRFDVENVVGSLNYTNFMRVMPFYYGMALMKKFMWGGVQEDLSIFFITYNPNWEKYKKSLISILEQKHITYEIIVSDDGSEDNCFGKVIELFKRYGFTRYKLLSAKENQGTVVNVLRALNNANGIFVRGLSPGDLLPKATHLSEWYNWCIKNEILYSFGDNINYNDENGFQVQRHYNNPKNKWLYRIKISDIAIRTDYLILSDYVSGAAVMANRKFLIQYLTEIAGKVKYAEDNIVRLMQFDGIRLSYYPKIVELYEYGTGVSTSHNTKWQELLNNDRCYTNKIILSRQTEEVFQYKCKQYFGEEGSIISWKKRISKYLYFRWAAVLKIISMMCPAKTRSCPKDVFGFYEQIKEKRS